MCWSRFFSLPRRASAVIMLHRHGGPALPILHASSSSPRHAPLWLAAGLLAVAGCKSPKILPAIDSSKPITDTAVSIRTEADGIVKSSTDGQAVAPTLPNWTVIGTAAHKIIDATVSLDQQAATLKVNQNESAKVIAEKDKEIAKLKDTNSVFERHVFSMLVIVGALGLVASAILGYFFGPKLGGIVAVASVSAIVVGRVMSAEARFESQYGWAINGAIAALVLFGIGLLGFGLYMRRNQLWADAIEKAKLIKSVMDPAHPEDVRELVAAERAKDPVLHAAMASDESNPGEPKPTEPKP